MKQIWIMIWLISLVSADQIVWTLPETISSAGSNAFASNVALDGNGNAVALWIEDGLVKTKYKPFQGQWSSATTLSISEASFCSLLMDVNGNATAIWLESGIIKSSTKLLNQSWSSLSTLSNPGASVFHAAIDTYGNIVVVWARNGHVESITRFYNGTWPGYVDVLSSNNASHPRVGIGKNGTVIVVWQNDTTKRICLANKKLQDSWGPSINISTAGKISGYPSVAVNSSGNFAVTWFQWVMSGLGFTNVICQSAVYQNGNWIYSQLSSAGVQPPECALVQMNDQGDAIAMWTNSLNGSTYNLQSSIYTSGAWSTPVNILLDNCANCYLDLIPLVNGEYRAIFLSYNSTDFMMRIQSKDIHTNGYYINKWSNPTTISTGGNNAFPKIATVAIGNSFYAAAAWSYYDGLNSVIQVAFGTGTELESPTNLSVVQNKIDYGVFQEYQNIFSWEAVANATEYIVFRNGVFVAKLSSSTLQYIDYNQVQNGAVTYGVAAIDSDYDQTPVISIHFPVQN